MKSECWSKPIKQHVYYESSMFPDFKFATLKQARLAELGEMLKSQMSQALAPLPENVDKILEEIRLVHADEHKPVWIMSDEFCNFQEKLREGKEK